jgi:hypothetical protein
VGNFSAFFRYGDLISSTWSRAFNYRRRRFRGCGLRCGRAPFAIGVITCAGLGLVGAMIDGRARDAIRYG